MKQLHLLFCVITVSLSTTLAQQTTDFFSILIPKQVQRGSPYGKAFTYVKNGDANAQYIKDGNLVKQYDLERNCDYMYVNSTSGKFQEYSICNNIMTQYQDGVCTQESINISISQTWKDQLYKFVLDTNTYKNPLGLKDDTTSYTYKRLYYSDNLGNTSLYIYDSAIYYEVFETVNISKAIFYYNGLNQREKYACQENFTMIYSRQICSQTFSKQSQPSDATGRFMIPAYESLKWMSLFQSADLANQTQQAMKLLDLNQDGKINLTELKKGIESQGQILSDSEVVYLMSIVDTNHDDQISYDELLAFAKQNQGSLFRVYEPKSLILEISNDEKVELIFDSYDQNDDDELSQKEIERLFQDTYGYVNCQNLYNFISDIDQSGDDIITKNEMLQIPDDSSQ